MRKTGKETGSALRRCPLAIPTVVLPKTMSETQFIDFPTAPIRTRVVADARNARLVCAMAGDAGCAVVDVQTGPLGFVPSDIDLVLCDTAVWPRSRSAFLASGSHSAVVLVETGDSPEREVLRDPLVDDWVDVGAEVSEVRIRIEHAVTRRSRQVNNFDGVGFAPGSIDGLRPLHGSLEALISALEAKDPYTRDHSHRVCATALNLASQIAPGDPLFQERIRVASLFHDIGKIGVPEAVLNKPGALDPDEWAAVQRHVLCGVSILRPIVDDATLAMVRHHHERWDGKGYPDGVARKDIPLGARIIAVADSWDAMTSARPYRPSMQRQKVWEILRDGAGKQWDPEIVPIFLKTVGTAQPRLAA